MQGSDDVDIYDSKEFSTEQNSETWSSFGVDNWKEHLSDDMLYALAKIKPIYAEAFILQACGYSLKEIVEISHKNGNLKIKNIDTVKSRLFLARTQLKSIINRDGELLRENN